MSDTFPRDKTALPRPSDLQLPVDLPPDPHGLSPCQSDETHPGSNAECSTFKEQVASLIAEARRWQKRNDDALYRLLERVLETREAFDETPARIADLHAVLKEKGLRIRSDTSPELALLRAMFGEIGSSLHAYAAVLRIARAEKPTGQSLGDFIRERGGIEAMRRAASPTSAEKRREAERVFRDSLARLIDGPRIALPDEIACEADYAVLLVRRDETGDAYVMLSSEDDGAVKDLVTRAQRGAAASADAAEEDA